MIAGYDALPVMSSEISLMVCWMNPRPMQLNGKYAVKHNTRDVKCVIDAIDYVLNINTWNTSMVVPAWP